MYSKTQSGAIVPFTSILLVFILGFVAYAVDVGRTWSGQKHIQVAADAGSIAGALLVSDVSNTDAEVIARANLFALSNGLTSDEIANGGWISVGHWDVVTATYTSGGTPRNAVQVLAQRDVPMMFAVLLGIFKLTPPVRSIAASLGPEPVCVKPFGLDPLLVSTLVPGDIFNVGWANPGNWWKVDLAGINMSAGKNFEDAMLGNMCPDAPGIDDTIDAATGFGGPISGVFQKVINANKQTFVVPVVTRPSNGSSEVVVKGFAEVGLRDARESGKNGRQWEAEFKLLRYPVEVTSGTSGGPVVVRAFVR